MVHYRHKRKDWLVGENKWTFVIVLLSYSFYWFPATEWGGRSYIRQSVQKAHSRFLTGLSIHAVLNSKGKAERLEDHRLMVFYMLGTPPPSLSGQ